MKTTAVNASIPIAPATTNRLRWNAPPATASNDAASSAPGIIAKANCLRFEPWNDTLAHGAFGPRLASAVSHRAQGSFSRATV